jgi:ligand-binding SRPBCC domain-containing protein
MIAIVVMRVLVGWHFMYEGIAKLTSPSFTAAGYLKQARGPFAVFRHRHGIEAEVREGVEGTLVTDEIEFALPHGRIGQVGGVLVQRQLAAQFAHRQQRLPEILAAAARQAARRA